MPRILFSFFLLIFGAGAAFAQPNMKDSLDGKLDMSDWVLDAHGFIPVPLIITEPALGDIGGGLFGIFIAKNDPYVDTVDNKVVYERVRPDIYGIGGAYTANGTWLVGALASGTIRNWRARYRVVAAYADVNLNFYKDFPNDETYSFEFNIKTIPFNGQLIKQISRGSNWYAGLDYLYLKTDIQQLDPEFIDARDKEALISRVGAIVDFDARDNIFTPDKGIRWNTVVSASDPAIGSDYTYQQAATALFGYAAINKNLIAGFRAEYVQVWGETPFYMLPFINMRGIPVARYQGEIVPLAETEWRWDMNLRWSLVGFAGGGKAFNEWSDFEDSDWRYSGGAGFRYLMARKLKLRMGLDIARGPEEFAWYMVFGTSWVK